MTGKPFYQSKLFWLGVLTLLISILQQLAGFQELKDYSTLILEVVGVLVIVLRFVTTMPITSNPTLPDPPPVVVVPPPPPPSEPPHEG